MPRYDYDVMPGMDWYSEWGEVSALNFRDAAKTAVKMWKAGVRDIVINVYDLIGEDVADFFYVVNDEGKVVKR